MPGSSGTLDGAAQIVVSAESIALPLMPGKLVNLVGGSDLLLRVMVQINNKEVLAVIDSGAIASLMSLELAQSLNLSISSDECIFSVIGDKSVSSLGKVECSLSIHGVPMADNTFCVFPTVISNRIPLLLGVDFLQNNGIELCIKKRLIVKHCTTGGTAEIYLDDLGHSRQVMLVGLKCFANSDVHVEPGKVEAVPLDCPLPNIEPDHMLFYSDDAIDHSLSNDIRGFSGIAGPNTRHVLMTTGGSALTIKKGQFIGTVSTVVQLPSDQTAQPNGIDIEELKSQVNIAVLNSDQQSQVFSMLCKFGSVFSGGDTDIGLACVTEHNIKLTNDTPIFQRPRRFPPPIADEIERQCHELNSLDIIEPSNSPWSSPVVPVRKKDGSIRMCIDYRQLNRVTVPDKFPVPNLADSIFGLHGTKFFTRLDLVRGYYQIPIDEQSRPFTAFSTPRNHWQFKRLSFGLRNA
ncbi:uncharacterized protein LOC108671710, partial [Hyalella azteca]|uniref:Uncharacterized protein LOC108671710 n=1 Tax=Hyalella azteca TaxID=294128 RepID=A0A8B7NM62_HYAAZ